jgi:hypothetical protein
MNNTAFTPIINVWCYTNIFKASEIVKPSLVSYRFHGVHSAHCRDKHVTRLKGTNNFENKRVGKRVILKRIFRTG